MNIKNKKLFFGLFALYIVIMIVLCVIGIIPSGNNTWEKGATIYFPYNDQAVGRDFTLAGSAYSKDEIQSINVLIEPGNIKIPAEREKIYYKEEELFALSTFSAPVSIDNDGEYTAVLQITDSTGTYEYDTLNFASQSTVSTKGFEMFSGQHMLALLAVVVAYIVILLIYKKYPHTKTKNIIYALISLAIVACDISVKIWLIKNGVFKASYDAFFHMCDFSGPFLIIMFYMKDSIKKQKFFSLMFIWGVLGAAMALLTPEMRGNAFPSLYFMTFFIKHGVIVIGVLIAGVIEKYNPKMRHLPQVIGVSLLIVAFVYAVDKLIVHLPPYEPGNYMFLSYPPTGGSALDILVKIFGPSPFYIIGMVLLASVLYTIMWGIYAVIGKLKKD